MFLTRSKPVEDILKSSLSCLNAFFFQQRKHVICSIVFSKFCENLQNHKWELIPAGKNTITDDILLS